MFVASGEMYCSRAFSVFPPSIEGREAIRMSALGLFFSAMALLITAPDPPGQTYATSIPVLAVNDGRVCSSISSMPELLVYISSFFGFVMEE